MKEVLRMMQEMHFLAERGVDAHIETIRSGEGNRFLTTGQNNWDGNIMHLRGACHIPFGKRLTYEQDGKTFIGVEGWL